MGFGNILGPISLQQKSLAALPSAVGLRTGIVYEISDYGGNIATVVNGVWRFEYPFRTTWAGRPAVGLVPVGTELQVTDYGNQKWINNGTVWRPAQGHAVLLNKWGSVTAPLAIVTGVSDMQFSLPVSLIKAELIIPDGVLTAIAWVRRTGANGTAYVNTRLGTLNAYTDAVLGNQSISATDALSVRTNVMATPGLTSLSSLSGISPNGTGTAAVVSSSNFNLASDMNFSIYIRTANAADSFSLIGYQLIQEV